MDDNRSASTESARGRVVDDALDGRNGLGKVASVVSVSKLISVQVAVVQGRKPVDILGDEIGDVRPE